MPGFDVWEQSETTKRFPDGSFVRTSVVVARFPGGIITENGSSCTLGNKHPQNGAQTQGLYLSLTECRDGSSREVEPQGWPDLDLAWVPAGIRTLKHAAHASFRPSLMSPSVTLQLQPALSSLQSCEN